MGRAKRGRWTDQQNLFVYRFIYALMGLLVHLWIRCFRVEGGGNVPRQGGAFLIANHSSGIDPLLIGYSVPQRVMTGPGKIELFQNPFFAWVMRRLGIFPLRQDIVDAGAVRTMVARYRQGDVVIVYPEGGRSATTEMRPFNPDFTRLAIRLKAPIIPAGIAGARDVLPIGTWIPRYRTPVAVVIGRPFDLSAFYGRPLDDDVLAEATAVLRDAVAHCVECAQEVRSEVARRC